VSALSGPASLWSGNRGDFRPFVCSPRRDDTNSAARKRATGKKWSVPLFVTEPLAAMQSLCGPSLQTKAKDFQFGNEHFRFFESNKALLHFSSIYLWQIVWAKGFIHAP
jgi:hypothetical protein